ncbi:MAG: superoxide dismutase family protein [Cyanophyceae cyanobacterium]
MARIFRPWVLALVNRGRRAIAVLLGGFLIWGSAIAPAAADRLTVELFTATATGPGAAIGQVIATDTDDGLLLAPDLHGLPPGLHGFHLHSQGSCDPAEKDGAIVPALAAGGHFDPDRTQSHQGPYGHGHGGDLPAIAVSADGTATLPILAPHLRADAFQDRAVILHKGGDNYSDDPAPLGGGGARLACGLSPVVKS